MLELDHLSLLVIFLFSHSVVVLMMTQSSCQTVSMIERHPAAEKGQNLYPYRAAEVGRHLHFGHIKPTVQEDLMHSSDFFAEIFPTSVWSVQDIKATQKHRRRRQK